MCRIRFLRAIIDCLRFIALFGKGRWRRPNLHIAQRHSNAVILMSFQDKYQKKHTLTAESASTETILTALAMKKMLVYSQNLELMRGGREQNPGNWVIFCRCLNLETHMLSWYWLLIIIWQLSTWPFKSMVSDNAGFLDPLNLNVNLFRTLLYSSIIICRKLPTKIQSRDIIIWRAN